MNANGPHLAVWSFLIVAMLAVILLIGVVVLLAFKATRPLGVGLLLFFVGGGFLLTIGYMFMSVRAVPNQVATRVYPYPEYHESHSMEAAPIQRYEASARMEQSLPAVAPPVQQATETAQPAATAEQPASPVPAEATTVDGQPAVEEAQGAATPAATVESPAEANATPAEATTLPAEATTLPAEANASPAEAPAQAINPPAQATAEQQPASIVATVSPEKAETVKPPRPAWIEAAPHREQQDYQVAVKSGLFVTPGECERALDKAMQRKVNEYIDEYIEDGAAELVAVDTRFIQQRIRRDSFSETVAASVGPMQQIHALLVIDDGVRSYFQQRWRQARVEARLWQVGAGSAAVLGLIGSLCVFLGWGQRTAPQAAVATAAKPAASLATYNHFWLHCALIVAILVGVLAFLL